MSRILDITILCKVIDNFGDIGFVYRLSKDLRKINRNYRIRMVVNDLFAFQKIAPKINPNSAKQFFCGMVVFNSQAENVCKNEFAKTPPHMIVECFQCGRPKWLDEILFEPNAQEKSSDKERDEGLACDKSSGAQTYQIINIDYLTAEEYAEEFHCLKSGTRSAVVKKVNFMPGFTAKTGGLILDEPFITNWRMGFENVAIPDKHKKVGRNTSAVQNILIFSYRKNFLPVLRAFYRMCNKRTSQIQILLAQGAGKKSFLESYHNFCETTKFDVSQIHIDELDFLSQEKWDEMFLQMDILFVRGEDSLARACLCGKPFVWNAYPQETAQDKNYHLVKIRALLERMRPHFANDEFTIIERFWLLYNVHLCDVGAEQDLENICFDFLSNARNLKRGFESFSESIFALGNFSKKLDAFIQSL